MVNTKYALTTIDNPYDPFEQFDSWFLFDTEKGYNTCGYIARIIDTLPEFKDDPDSDEAAEAAIDEIIRNDFLNVYKKVENKNLKEKK